MSQLHRLARSILGRAGRFVEPKLSRGLSLAFRTVRFEFYVLRLHRRAVARAARLPLDRPLRLNLGSGFHPKPGWVNVDLIDEGSDLQLDLREPLPFPDSSVAQVYTEHFFEHLHYPSRVDSLGRMVDENRFPSEALGLLRECHRVLAPGGRIDVIVPDAGVTLREYAASTGAVVAPTWWGPAWCDTPMHRVNYVFRQGHEHQYAYDFETLAGLLRRAGFVSIVERPFDPALDYRQQSHALVVVAAKPAGSPDRVAAQNGSRPTDRAVTPVRPEYNRPDRRTTRDRDYR